MSRVIIAILQGHLHAIIGPNEQPGKVVLLYVDATLTATPKIVNANKEDSSVENNTRLHQVTEAVKNTVNTNLS